MTVSRGLVSTVGLCLALAAAAVTAPSVSAQQVSVVATGAWMREALPASTQTAVFVTLDNRSTQPRSVVGAASPVATTAELHTMTMRGEMMRMEQVKAIDVMAGGRTELKPGGLHIMLFGMKSRPAPGARVPVTLTLDNGQTIEMSAEVRAAAPQR